MMSKTGSKMEGQKRERERARGGKKKKKERQKKKPAFKESVTTCVCVRWLVGLGREAR